MLSNLHWAIMELLEQFIHLCDGISKTDKIAKDRLRLFYTPIVDSIERKFDSCV